MIRGASLLGEYHDDNNTIIFVSTFLLPMCPSDVRNYIIMTHRTLKVTFLILCLVMVFDNWEFKEAFITCLILVTFVHISKFD